MAKHKDDSTTALVDTPVKVEKPKSAQAILHNCIAQLENHPDAKVIAVNSYAPRERVWYDEALRDQEEVQVRVVLKIKTK